MLLAAQLSGVQGLPVTDLLFPSTSTTAHHSSGLTVSTQFFNATNNPQLTYTGSYLEVSHGIHEEISLGIKANEDKLSFNSSDASAQLSRNSLDPFIRVNSQVYKSTLSPSHTETLFFIEHSGVRFGSGFSSRNHSFTAGLKNNQYELNTDSQIAFNHQQLMVLAAADKLSFQANITIDSELDSTPYKIHAGWKSEQWRSHINYTKFNTNTRFNWALNKEANGASTAEISGTELTISAAYKNWVLTVTQQEANAQLFNSMVVNNALVGSIGKGQYLFIAKGSAQLNSLTLSPPPYRFNHFESALNLSVSDITQINGQAKYYEPLLFTGLPILQSQYNEKLAPLQLGLIDAQFSYTTEKIKTKITAKQLLLLKHSATSTTNETSDAPTNPSSPNE